MLNILIRKAKKIGIEIIHEVIINPTSGLTMLEENDLFPNVDLSFESLEVV